jgi:hypothetical protein
MQLPQYGCILGVVMELSDDTKSMLRTVRRNLNTQDVYSDDELIQAALYIYLNWRESVQETLNLQVCPACSRLTTEKHCPFGCQTVRGKARTTMSILDIPAVCWECRRSITTPLHERSYLGLCQDCTRIKQN